MTSVWVGQDVKLSVQNKLRSYFLPVGGPQGDGKYYMDVNPDDAPLYSAVTLQVEPFDDQQPYVAFEAVAATAGSCTLDATVVLSDGVLALTPWPAPDNSPPRGLSIADMTGTVEYGWGFISQTVTVGYEWETETSSTNSFSDTFTSRADAGFKLGPFGAGASITDVTARSTVSSIRADTKVQKTDSYTAGCTFRNHEDASSYVTLWQFVMSGPQQMPGASAAAYASVFSRLYTCTYSNSGAPPQPKCLPSLCKDDLCQTCCATLDECSSSSFGAVEAIPPQRTRARGLAAKKGNLRGSNKDKN